MSESSAQAAPAKRYDLIVIGAGPGGYVAAIRAAQLGLKVACVEREPKLGGTCLRVGCIPSKALLESSQRYHDTQHVLARHGIQVGQVSVDLAALLGRKDQVVDTLTQGISGLFRKNKVDRYEGNARFQALGHIEVEREGEPSQSLRADKIIIATGSKVATLPGIVFDDAHVGTSTEALSYPEVPKRLIVIGAGVIGLELGSVWARLGAEVTVLEYLDRILPGMDLEVARKAQQLLSKQGLNFRLGVKVTGAKAAEGQAEVTLDGGETLQADRVLVAVGRRPNTDDLGLEAISLSLDSRGRIPVDEHYQTAVPGVFAIGDVIQGPMLAHKAEEEGVACVERIVTGYGHVNYGAIPAVVYTHPEIASVGRTEEELKEAGVAYRKGSFPFLANGRARAIDQVDGFVKILADAETDRVLGAHILGPQAGDLIAEVVTAMEFGASAEDIARTCHAHPNLAEAIKEAALAVDKRPIHI